MSAVRQLAAPPSPTVARSTRIPPIGLPAGPRRPLYADALPAVIVPLEDQAEPLPRDVSITLRIISGIVSLIAVAGWVAATVLLLTSIQ